MVEEAEEIRILSVDVAWMRGGVPHILRGASSSRRIGCWMKISLHLWQRPLISPSRRLTCLGILELRTDSSFSIMLSTFISILRYII